MTKEHQYQKRAVVEHLKEHIDDLWLDAKGCLCYGQFSIGEIRDLQKE